MLYDPKWEKTVEADPFTLESLIAWLERMPADGAYEWGDCDGGCLIGLYGQAISRQDWCSFHTKLFNRDQLFIARQFPHTFGAALARARTAIG